MDFALTLKNANLLMGRMSYVAIMKLTVDIRLNNAICFLTTEHVITVTDAIFCTAKNVSKATKTKGKRQLRQLKQTSAIFFHQCNKDPNCWKRFHNDILIL
jgi:hypothetical protein